MERAQKLVGGAGGAKIERRHCVRHKVHAPAFASFDGVTGGMILDLSEHGMAMQTAAPQKASRPLRVHLNLPEPVTNVETTGYIAWADAFGRAGVRFSELPEEGRARLKEWLNSNATAPSRRAPKLNLAEQFDSIGSTMDGGMAGPEPLAISLEPEAATENPSRASASTTVQYEFAPLGRDLNAALRLIAERARSITRATGAAIALMQGGAMVCRGSAGTMSPPVGTLIDSTAGFSAECVRTGKALRCDNSDTDPYVDVESCRRLGIRSIIAAPIQYERAIIGVIEVFSNQPFAFDEGDVAVAQRLAQTVVIATSQSSRLGVS
jgi:hypothetical protein